MVFSTYQKVPRSPIPSAGKSFRGDVETKRKAPALVRDKGQLPVSVLADVDSLFITCQGLIVHYKLSLPASPSRSLSSATSFHFSPHSTPPKSHLNFQKSASNTFHTSNSALYTPLLASSPPSPTSENVPILCLNENCAEDLSIQDSPQMEQEITTNDQFGIVLVHGFGGGVFSWRKVIGPLARNIGCTVAAFDRPGWGLTSRPQKKDWVENPLTNPFKIDNQVGDCCYAYVLRFNVYIRYSSLLPLKIFCQA